MSPAERSTMRPVDKWWWPKETFRVGRPTVLLFSGAGVEQSWIANPLIPHLDDYNFGVWRMPGRGTRVDEPDPTNLRVLSREVAEGIRDIGAVRPVLGGHSFGGYFGYIVTQELEKLGVEVGRLVTITTACPTEFRLGAAYARLHGGPDKYIKRRLAKAIRNQTLPPEYVGPDQFESVGRAMGVDFTLGFGELSRAVIDTSITDISVSDDEKLLIKKIERWRPYTRGDFDSIVTTGGHAFVLDKPEVVTRVLNREAEIAYNRC